MKRTAENLGNHELIGLDVKALRASQVEFEGRVVDETMNTFILDSGSREQRVPKHGYMFHFNLNNEIIRINGDRIRFRPEDRTKKVKFRPQGGYSDTKRQRPYPTAPNKMR